MLLAACGGGDEAIPAAMRPLPKEAQTLLAKKGMSAESPIFIRVFKEESELEVWKQREDGRFHHFKSYPVCNWSGGLGPKIKEGDKQAPEGFYTVSQTQMNPSSQFHLAFNLGFPNAYDKAHGRTGGHLMVHGDCRSAGCYAMTDALVEEIYALAREAFKGGQEKFDIHAFPFRMTPDNMKRHAKHEWMPFWRTLKDGYEYFELTRLPPPVTVCDKRYLVNARFQSNINAIRADGPCPAYERPKPDLFVVKPGTQVAEEQRVLAPGKKTRDLVAEAATGNTGSAGSTLTTAQGLTRIPRSIFSWGFSGTSSGSADRASRNAFGFSQ
jgi:murein L,D-transpeptidase YafK